MRGIRIDILTPIFMFLGLFLFLGDSPKVHDPHTEVLWEEINNSDSANSTRAFHVPLNVAHHSFQFVNNFYELENPVLEIEQNKRIQAGESSNPRLVKISSVNLARSNTASEVIIG